VATRAAVVRVLRQIGAGPRVAADGHADARASDALLRYARRDAARLVRAGLLVDLAVAVVVLAVARLGPGRARANALSLAPRLHGRPRVVARPPGNAVAGREAGLGAHAGAGVSPLEEAARRRHALRALGARLPDVGGMRLAEVGLRAVGDASASSVGAAGAALLAAASVPGARLWTGVRLDDARPSVVPGVVGGAAGARPDCADSATESRRGKPRCD